MAGVDPKALTALRTIADAGSISGAAVRLGVAQSALSARLAALEASVGVGLFDRLPRGVRLTPAGARLLPYADQLAELTLEAIAAARGVDRVDAGPFRLGAIEVIAATMLPPALARFLREQAGVEVRLTTGVTSELIAAIDEHYLDAAIVADNGALGDRDRFNLDPLPLALATAAGLDPHLVSHAFGFGDGCVCSTRMRAIANRNGWTMKFSELGSLDAIIGCVTAGLGVAVLPRAVLEHRDLELATVPPLKLVMIHRPERWAAANALKRMYLTDPSVSSAREP